MRPRLVSLLSSPYLISIGTVIVLALALLAGELATRYVAPELCARARAIYEVADDHLELVKPCARRVVKDGSELLHVFGTFGEGRWIPFRKPPGVVRIAVVGESSGELLGESLGQLIDDLQCGSTYEVLNCARSAADLGITERMFDEALSYEPDAVVVVFGHNIRYQYDLEPTRLRARKIVASSCLLASLLPEPSGEAVFRMSTVDSKLPGLEAFLRRAAETSRRREFQLVLSTMPVNLFMPPHTSDLSRDASGSEAILLAEEGKLDSALASLAAAGGDEAERRFRAGVWLARAGRTAEAYVELQRAVDEDPGPNRRPSAVNALIRRVARESGATLRDTEVALETRAPGGLPGWESFVDNCHLTPAGIDIEARELLDLVSRAGTCDLSGRPVSGSPPDQSALERLLDGVLGSWGGRAFYQALQYAIASHYMVDRRHTLAAVERAVARIEAEALPRSEILVAIAEAWRQVDRTGEARRINKMARQRDPANVTAIHQAAILAWRDGNDVESRAFAEQAIRLDRTDQLAPALLRHLDGSTREASPLPGGFSLTRSQTTQEWTLTPRKHLFLAAARRESLVPPHKRKA